MHLAVKLCLECHELCGRPPGRYDLCFLTTVKARHQYGSNHTPRWPFWVNLWPLLAYGMATAVPLAETRSWRPVGRGVYGHAWTAFGVDKSNMGLMLTEQRCCVGPHAH